MGGAVDTFDYFIILPQVAEMMQQADQDGDGQVSFEEFKCIMGGQG